MYQFNILIYFVILGLIVRSQNALAIFLFIVFGIAVLSLIPYYRKKKKEKIEKNIKQNPDKEIINVNKASWWEFECLPEVSRVQAKKMVWIRNHNGRYISKEDFLNKNEIKSKEAIEKLIII